MFYVKASIVFSTQPYYSCRNAASFPLIILSLYYFITSTLACVLLTYQTHNDALLRAFRNCSPFILSVVVNLLLYVSPIPPHVLFNVQSLVLCFQSSCCMWILVVSRRNIVDIPKTVFLSDPNNTLNVSALVESPTSYKSVSMLISVQISTMLLIKTCFVHIWN
jgi:hypothetical protein